MAYNVTKEIWLQTFYKENWQVADFFNTKKTGYWLYFINYLCPEAQILQVIDKTVLKFISNVLKAYFEQFLSVINQGAKMITIFHNYLKIIF